MMKKALIIVTLALFNNALVGNTLIDQPGKYLFGSNLSGADLPIEVAASNVIIDLDQYILSTAALGILINTGLQNIEIRNGTITNISTAGIRILDACAGIKINNMTISGCAKSALELIGTATSRINNVQINNLTIGACALSPLATAVLSVTETNGLIMQSCGFVSNGATTSNYSLIKLTNCTRCLFVNNIEQGNSGNALVMNDLDHCSSCGFNGMRIRNNTAVGSGTAFTSFKFTNTCTDNPCRDILVLNNITTTGSIRGFDLQNGSKANIFTQCMVVNSNAAVDFYGFILTGSGTSHQNNLFGFCQVTNNNASSGNSIGVSIAGSDSGGMNNCVFQYNNAPNGTSVGIRFELGTGGNDWAIKDAQIVRNNGSSNANSWGIDVQTGLRNAFLRNIAFDNGKTPANQLNGVPSNSQTQADSDNINTITAPWSNLALNSP